MLSKIKNAGLFLILGASLAGCLNVEMVEAPPRSDLFPDKYLACEERVDTRRAVSRVNEFDLTPGGVEVTRGRFDGCRVATVSSEAFISRAGRAFTDDGELVRLYKISQFGFEYTIADTRDFWVIGRR